MTGRSLGRHSAVDIAQALGRPTPTEEQQAVIEARPRPLLVVAGAGSGKTETMASRVVWLVANGFVEPDQVLGLTFTRKAASELVQRVAQRLRALARVGLWAPPLDEGTGVEVLGGTPTVSTYHAYAGRLVREHALRLGVDPEFRLVTEAGAWQLAAEAVARYDGPTEGIAKAESTVIAGVVSLAGELAEHLLTPEAGTAHLDELLDTLQRLPDGDGRGSLAPVRDLIATLGERRAVLPMVRAYLDLKRSRECLDFGDQMALAARLAAGTPAVGAVERQRFRAVLLDEFQDTSEAQLVLLRSLFHQPGAEVILTAVGDPNQSIYGWRGASATTLARFPGQFGDQAGPADVLPLSTSWRNDRAILDAANVTAGALHADNVAPLTPRPDAGAGSITVARLGTVAEEMRHVAQWVATHWRTPSGRRTGRSAAVLCRRRAHFPLAIEALREQGLPVEVVGLGGLLLTPEVGDLVSVLEVVQDPSRGDRLLRLLVGPFARLGPADLDGLWAWARELHHRPWRPGHAGAAQAVLPLDVAGPGGAEVPEAVSDLAPESADEAALVEAIDELPPPGWVSRSGARIGETARLRLTALAEVVRSLRRLTALPLVDLVTEAERALGLDIEVLARPEHTDSTARVHLDAFTDVAARYAASSDRPTLAGFLAWLDAAREQERGLDVGHVESDSEAVQVLTVHAAKGLEWDVVAVPCLVESVFPDHSASAVSLVDDEWRLTGTPTDKGWLTGIDAVPYELRGDRDGLPRLDWRGAPDRRVLSRAIEAFAVAGGDHALAEERRLAYVAFTRARSELLLSTHFWGATRKSLAVPSRFLTEVVTALPDRVTTSVHAERPDPVDGPRGTLVAPSNPFLADGQSAPWPCDPMASRRARLLDVVDRVVALAAADAESSPSGDPRHSDLQLLLAERDARHAPVEAVVDVPRHLSASAVLALARDAHEFAATLRRPMPLAPAPAARQGTAFHAWVEEHYARATIVDVLELPGSADEEPADASALARMKQLFLASEWADRVPEEIELAVETVLDGIAVRGRIDAVFPRGDGGWTVVDWKTGPAPTGREAAVRALQLNTYAVAYARLRDVDIDRVDAAFYYAGQGLTVRHRVPGEEELVRLLAAVPG